MTKIHSNDTKAGTLHDKALALLKNKPSESGSVAEYVNDTILKLIHEVEVHQIELELQNEELLTARTIAQKSSEKYIELYDFAPSGYITLSKTGEIIDLNFSGANLLGKSREQLKKSHLAFFISHETKPIFQHFLENIFKNNMKESCEVIFIPENSEPLFVNISGITTENSEQCLLNLVDVTEYLKTQEIIIEKNNQLALQNQELERRAAELLLINKELAFQIYEKYLLETKLIIAKEKAEESERLKSSFLANMSHEIRTPMNGILGFMQLLKTPGLTPEKQLKYISMIEMGGERMLEIINDIIDISKIQTGVTKVSLLACNVNEQIKNLFNFFKPEVESKGMHFFYQTDLPEDEAIILTDREKVYAVLTNLVKNAIKYSERGNIEIGYRFNPEETTLVGTEQKPGLVFFVKDSGIGIAPDQLNSIFNRFFQIESNTQKSKNGVGLGLAIAKSYVEMLEGKLWVESELGKGSTFYFSLPYYHVREEFKESKISIQDIEKEINIKKLKILIADDDESSLMLTDLMVNKYSKEILHVENGLDAVEVCQHNNDIDLILMDINMPKMNGRDATREIRKFNKDIYIIAQTAYAYTEDQKKVIEAGCDDYITKPLNQSMLIRMIKNHFTS